MNNKIILCADLHIKDGLYCQVGLDFIDYLCAYCTDNDINKIAFLGDLLDKSSRIHNDVFVPLFKKIESIRDSGIEMWFILGNHDITSTLTNSSILEVFENYGHLVNSAQTYEFGNTVVNMCPFTKDAALVPTVNADYLFSHLNITGFDIGGNRKSGEEQQAFAVSMFSNYEKVYTGHYHKRQEIENVQYVGSPYQLNFGDCGDYNKGFVVLDLDSHTEDFVKYTNAPIFKKFSYDEIINNIKNGIVGEDDLKNNLIKITVDKKVDELSKLKSILYNKFGVVDIVNEFENPKEELVDEKAEIEMNVSISDMICEFISKINVEKDGFLINGSELVDKFYEIRGEK